MRRYFSLAVVIVTVAMSACTVEQVQPPTTLSRISVENNNFRDESGRYLLINGVNVSGTSKVPVSVSPVSYVGRPFPIDEVDGWFEKLRRDGFNAIRLLAVWEAVCPEQPGVYDTEYLDYLEQVISKANDHGIYVLINFHENLFSRHLYSVFNDHPTIGEPGSWQSMIGSLFPAKDPETGKLYYDSKVVGDGAPRWAVEACLPEKDLDAPTYGMLRILGDVTMESGNLGKLISAFMTLLSGGEGGMTPEIQELIGVLSESLADLTAAGLLPYDMTQTNDMMPFTLWAMNSFLSVDVEKCYAAFFAGNEVFPGRQIDGVPIMDYLQQGHIDSWLQVVSRAKKYPNVLGYDVMNEPTGIFIVLSVVSAYVSAGFDNIAAYAALSALIDKDTVDAIYNIIDATGLLPSVPLELTEDAVATSITDPMLKIMRDAVEPRLIVLLDAIPASTDAPTFIATEPFKTDQATAIADARAEITQKATAKLGSMEPGMREAIIGQMGDQAAKVINDSIKNAAAAIKALPADVLADPESDAALMVKIEQKTRAYEAAAPLVADTVAEVRRQKLMAYWDSIKAEWGMADMDLFATIDLNMNLERKYMMRYWNRIGAAVQQEDPNAIIFIGDPLAINSLFGGEAMPMMNNSPYKPENVDNMVHSYHWYPGSIYPLGLFQVPPQKYEAVEWRTRDFMTPLSGKYTRTANTYGNVPLVFTEFGTYFNFNWNVKDLDSILATIEADGYEVSATILNGEYEAFEDLLAHKMVWCMSGDNDYQLGDLWNHEDFSIYGPDGEPRGEQGWLRPVVHVSAGEPIAMKFYSALHVYDPDKGESAETLMGEFHFAYEGRQSDLPTEIFVPQYQYPEGFYVWLSDGWAVFDPERQILYHYPTNDDPDWVHEVTIRRPAAGRYNDDWSYFFMYDGNKVVGDRNRGVAR
ncbi:MAG TPA: cellulase family glycosylhydrolase [Myxococcota bacterium]|nr:cellulase family glycosylhydrolase [Myxococcota bacterium]HNZ04025.1 cellulase family glycosylhydrolase [Myxococcota bacterium]